MAAGPYTREEIEAFVGATLKVLKTGDAIDGGKVRQIYTQAIEKLVPWRQVLLVESHNLSIAGDSGAINHYYKKAGDPKHANVLGFFQPGAMSMAFNGAAEMTVVNAVFWQADQSVVNRGLHSQAHEEGHRIDWIVGLARGGGTFLSRQIPELKAAMDAELRSRAERKQRGELPAMVADDEQGRGVISRLGQLSSLYRPGTADEKPIEIDGHRIDDTLYDDYRELEDHLALYKEPDAHDTETFAEMISHHTMLYARYEGNERAVDFILTKNYPHYWPAFRDMVIPELERHAEKLMEMRQNGIDGFMVNAWALARAQGQRLDEVALVRAAAIAAADGTLAGKSEAMRRKARLYENPHPEALRVYEEIAELRWHALTDGKQHGNWRFDPDKDGIRAQLEVYAERVGLDSYVDYIEKMRNELRELHAMDTAESAFRQSVGLPDIRPGSPEAHEFMALYDRLIDEGGAEAVKAYRQSLPLDKDIQSYFIAVAARMETRMTLAQDGSAIHVPATPPDPAVIAQELRVLAQQGGREAVREATRQILSEDKALTSYESRLTRTSQAIGNLVGVSPPYYAGPDILIMFDELYARGGAEAVKQEIKDLTVDPKVLAAYMNARDDEESARVSIEQNGSDISWGKKDGLYQPFSIAVMDMAKDFMPRLADDMLALVMKRDSGATMIAETQRLKMETHMTIARVLGKTLHAGGQGM